MPLCDYCSRLSGFNDRNFTRSGGSICDDCLSRYGHPDEPGFSYPDDLTRKARAEASRNAILDAARAHMIVLYIDGKPLIPPDPEAAAPRAPEIIYLQYTLKLFALSAHTLADAASRAAKEIPATADMLKEGNPFGEDLYELSLEIRSWADNARLMLETLRH